MYLTRLYRCKRFTHARFLITVTVAALLVVSAAPASAVTPEDVQRDPGSDVEQWLNESGYQDRWENLSAERDGPCDQVRALQGPCPGLELDDLVEWTTTYPEKAKTGDRLTYTGWLQNKLDLPLLATLEYSGGDSGVCSITSFATDAATPEVEPNTFVLAPRDVEEDVGGLAGVSDTVTFQLNGVADVPGDCTITVTAVVSSVDMAVGSHTMTTEVSLPLSSTADMGEVTFNCALETITDDASTQTVAAGEVDFEIEGLWLEPCGGSKSKWLGFAGVVVDTVEEDGKEVPIYEPSISVAATGEPKSNTGSIELEEGTHEFEVHAYIMETGWQDKWKCWISIAAVLVALGWITVATAGVGLVLAVLGAAIAIGLLLTGVCDFVIEKHTYTVTVKAEEEDDAAAEVVSDIDDLLTIPRPCEVIDCDDFDGTGMDGASITDPGDVYPGNDD